MDVGVEAQVAAAFAEIARDEGRVDLLVNNVGNYNPQDVTKLTPAVWDATLATNLSGAYYCCFHALALMPADGNIINIGMAGLEGIRANVRGADYYVSKTGLLVADALAGGRLRGRATSASTWCRPASSTTPSTCHRPRRSARRCRSAGPASCDDIAQAVEYLLDARYVTGVNIDVAGGYRL